MEGFQKYLPEKEALRMLDFDEEEALSRTIGNRKLLQEVVVFTISSVSEQLEELGSMIQKRQWAPAKKIMHTIKGSVGSCAASQLYSLAFRLENDLNRESLECMGHYRMFVTMFEAFKQDPKIQAFVALDDKERQG